MKFPIIVAGIACCLLVLCNSVKGQENLSPLERLLQVERADGVNTAIESQIASFRAMANKTFVATAEKTLAAKVKGREVQRSIMKSYAADLLLTSDVIVDADGDLLARLYRIGEPRLERSERQAVNARLANNARLQGKESFEQLKVMLELKRVGQGNLASQQKWRQLVADWVASRDVRGLSEEQLAWCLYQLRPVVPWDSAQGMTVTWEGTITAPRDGDYEFSVVPIDVGFEFGDRFHRQAMTVWVNGKVVIEAKTIDEGTFDDWESASTPSRLRASAATSIKVQFDYAYDDWEWDSLVGAPILFWEGPGTSRQVVPGSAFRTNEGQPGVVATYRWNHVGKAQEKQGIESNVETVWRGRPLLGFENRELRMRMANELLRRKLESEKLAAPRLEGEHAHALFADGETQRATFDCFESISTSERASAIRKLCEVSEHFKHLDHPRKLMQLYRMARPGVETEALDILACWGEQNADQQLFSLEQSDPTAVMLPRKYCRSAAAYHLVDKQPDCPQSLVDMALEDEEGRCSLPVAYIIAYGKLIHDSLDQWIEYLDGKLEEESIAGNTRVNWLIARAMTEEIRSGSTSRRVPSFESYNAGLAWLNEALDSAQDASTKQRVCLEILARALAALDYDAAEAAIARMPVEDSPVRKSLARFRQYEQDALAEQRQRSREAYYAEIARRRAQADERGRESAVSRYDKILGNQNQR